MYPGIVQAHRSEVISGPKVLAGLSYLYGIHLHREGDSSVICAQDRTFDNFALDFAFDLGRD